MFKLCLASGDLVVSDCSGTMVSNLGVVGAARIKMQGGQFVLYGDDKSDSGIQSALFDPWCGRGVSMTQILTTRAPEAATMEQRIPILTIRTVINTSG